MISPQEVSALATGRCCRPDQKAARGCTPAVCLFDQASLIDPRTDRGVSQLVKGSNL